jgi:hypothetical protein
MDRTATLSCRRAMLARTFERSRLAEEILVSVYERLVPVVCRRTNSRQFSQLPASAWRTQPARRA